MYGLFLRMTRTMFIMPYHFVTKFPKPFCTSLFKLFKNCVTKCYRRNYSKMSRNVKVRCIFSNSGHVRPVKCRCWVCVEKNGRLDVALFPSRQIYIINPFNYNTGSVCFLMCFICFWISL